MANPRTTYSSSYPVNYVAAMRNPRKSAQTLTETNSLSPLRPPCLTYTFFPTLVSKKEGLSEDPRFRSYGASLEQLNYCSCGLTSTSARCHGQKTHPDHFPIPQSRSRRARLQDPNVRGNAFGRVHYGESCVEYSP